MSVDMLVSQLDGVRRTGDHRWIARCPAHDDKHPSLAIRELDDGRILVHDFGGCGIDQVLAAVGLGFDALYPERVVEPGAKRERQPFSAIDVLNCVALEALVAAIAASRVAQGEPLAESDRQRLLLAASRLQSAVEVARGA